ncbi:MAG: hypothetical protein GEU99_07300 [Luteitalea sp.]|nr:hypothetical protein [Luteitalea sp.]
MPRNAVRACGVLSLVIGAGVLLGAGCAARSRAETRAPVAEPLQVPSVPSREIAGPAEPEVTLPADRVEMPEAKAPSTRGRGSRSAPPPREPDGAAAPKPGAASDSGAAADKKKPEAESILRTAETVDDKETEKRIREALRRASTDLGRLNFATLNDNAKKDYRSAQGFLQQAESALEKRNLSMASDQADKAEKLARGLTQRSSGSM